MLKQKQHIFSLFSIALLCTLYIYNYNETLALKKKLAQINKELHLKQVTFEARQEVSNKKIKQQQAQIERMQKR